MGSGRHPAHFTPDFPQLEDGTGPVDSCDNGVQGLSPIPPLSALPGVGRVPGIAPEQLALSFEFNRVPGQQRSPSETSEQTHSGLFDERSLRAYHKVHSNQGSPHTEHKVGKKSEGNAACPFVSGDSGQKQSVLVEVKMIEKASCGTKQENI